MSRTKHHGWFVRTFMTRPQRRAVKLWERDVVKTTDIERVDKPPHGHKPHVYYW